MKLFTIKQYISLMLLLIAYSTSAQKIEFENQTISTEAGNFGAAIEVAATFVDFDGDNDEDLFFCHYNGTKSSVYLYRNSRSGTYVPLHTPIKGLVRSAIDFADIDSDGDQDVLIVGITPQNFNPSAELYLNNGRASFSLKKNTIFNGVDFGSLAFADVDGDNDQDVLITGLNGIFNSTANLYLNNGKGNFSLSNALFNGVARGTVNFADIDGDDDKDVLITGLADNYEYTAKLYQNDGNGNFEIMESNSLQGVHGSAAAFSDVDADGDQDVLITGINENSEYVSTLYLNDGNGYFVASENTSIEGVAAGAVSFADIDGDNDKDVLISGVTKQANRISKMYLNNGSGIFQLAENTAFVGMKNGNNGFSDIDGDNDMDVMITGRAEKSGVFKLYKNITNNNESLKFAQSMYNETAGTCNKIQIYPNPNSGSIVFSSEYDFIGTYKVVNMDGKTVLEGRINKENNKRINFNLPTGVYFLHLLNTESGQQQFFKLVKN